MPASAAAIFISRFLTTWYVTFCLRRFRRISPSSETLRPRYSETIIAVAGPSFLGQRGDGLPLGLGRHVCLLSESTASASAAARRVLAQVSAARSRRAAGGAPIRRADGFARSRSAVSPGPGDAAAPEPRRPCDGLRHRGAPTRAGGGLVPASACPPVASGDSSPAPRRSLGATATRGPCCLRRSVVFSCGRRLGRRRSAPRPGLI